MAMKVVGLLFLAMLVVLTEHKAMGICWVGCTTSSRTINGLINCLVDCGTSCPLKCALDFAAKKSDISGLALCFAGCLSPFGAISNKVETLNLNMTVCNIGCSLGLCSEFINDNDKFGTCMKSCSENYCVGGNIALEKA